MKHRMRRVGIWLALVLALAPVAALAQDEFGAPTDPTEEFNKGKFFDLAVCVVSIAAIPPFSHGSYTMRPCTAAPP